MTSKNVIYILLYLFKLNKAAAFTLKIIKYHY